MAIFGSLSPVEQARQLANPEGSVGLEVAEWLNDNNRQSNAAVIRRLGVQPGNYVLEIGFGNGRAAPDVIDQSTDVRYAGIDLSPTMVEEAQRFNAALVAAGRASFHLASADHMPFPDASLRLRYRCHPFLARSDGLPQGDPPGRASGRSRYHGHP